MAVRVEFHDPVDVTHTVNALRAAAVLVEREKPTLAARFRRISDDLGAGLDDGLPIPSAWTAGDHEVPGLAMRAEESVA